MEISVLKKGLSFVPTTHFKVFEWIKDLNLFTRKLKWKKCYKMHDARRCLEMGIDTDDLPCLSLCMRKVIGIPQKARSLPVDL